MESRREWTFDDALREHLSEFDGPWLDEPDKVQWISETGFDCLMVRNQKGVWCGYVGVTAEHPWFDQDFNDVDADVHGGLTFADFCQSGKEEARGVCHVPFAGRTARVWWLGFDTGHFYDLVPIWGQDRHSPLNVYRGQRYVEQEVETLAQQALATMKGE